MAPPRTKQLRYIEQASPGTKQKARSARKQWCNYYTRQTNKEHGSCFRAVCVMLTRTTWFKTRAQISYARAKSVRWNKHRGPGSGSSLLIVELPYTRTGIESLSSVRLHGQRSIPTPCQKPSQDVRAKLYTKVGDRIYHPRFIATSQFSPRTG